MTRDRKSFTTSYNYIEKYVWNTSIEGIKKTTYKNLTNSLLESWKNVAMSDFESPQKILLACKTHWVYVVKWQDNRIHWKLMYCSTTSSCTLISKLVQFFTKFWNSYDEITMSLWENIRKSLQCHFDNKIDRTEHCDKDILSTILSLTSMMSNQHKGRRTSIQHVEHQNFHLPPQKTSWVPPIIHILISALGRPENVQDTQNYWYFAILHVKTIELELCEILGRVLMTWR